MSFVNVFVWDTDGKVHKFEGVTHARWDEERGLLEIHDGADIVAMFKEWDKWILEVPEPVIEDWLGEEDPI